MKYFIVLILFVAASLTNMAVSAELPARDYIYFSSACEKKYVTWEMRNEKVLRHKPEILSINNNGALIKSSITVEFDNSSNNKNGWGDGKESRSKRFFTCLFDGVEKGEYRDLEPTLGIEYDDGWMKKNMLEVHAQKLWCSPRNYIRELRTGVLEEETCSKHWSVVASPTRFHPDYIKSHGMWDNDVVEIIHNDKKYKNDQILKLISFP